MNRRKNLRHLNIYYDIVSSIYIYICENDQFYTTGIIHLGYCAVYLLIGYSHLWKT